MFIDEGAAQAAASGFFIPMLGDGGPAVTVAGGGGGGGGGTFDIEDGKIVRCGLVFGRTWLTCDDTRIPALEQNVADGVIYASVAHSAESRPELSVHHGSSLPKNGLDATHRALYVAVGKAWTDVRGAITIVAMD